MNYIFISAGRRFWFDLSVELSKVYGHLPVVWYGDAKLKSCFEGFFAGCRVCSSTDAAPNLTAVGDSMRKVLSSPNFHWIKDEAVKMMDRIDPHDLWSRKFREALFYKDLLRACEIVDSAQAEFLLLSESPHDVLSYLIWRVCRMLGMPCLHFEAASISPALVMVSADDRTLTKVTRMASADEPLLGVVLQCVNQYLHRYDSGSQPVYMDAQRDRENVHFSWGRKLRDYLLRFYPLYFALSCVERAGRKGTIYRLALRRLKLSGRDKTADLALSYARCSSSDFLGGRYVYFPLHFEPERTTSPDGGVYYDQFRVILELRARLPREILLVVKEHPSQHFINMRGFKGRDQGFYEVLKGLQGVIFASVEVSSKSLIDGSVGLATVTGTAALEAVLCKKPALVLGQAWFLGAPGTYVVGEFDVFLSACEEGVSHCAEAVREWIIDYFSRYAFFGCVNPSNEKYFSSSVDVLAVQSPSSIACQIDGYLKQV